MNVLIQFDKIGSLYAREKIVVGLVESTSYAYFNERRGVLLLVIIKWLEAETGLDEAFTSI